MPAPSRSGRWTNTAPASHCLSRSSEATGPCRSCRRSLPLYVQDQIALTPSLSLGLGVRYDWQNVFTDPNNLAPRASLAWAMSKSTVVRGGAGWFYDRAGGGPIREILRSRAARLFRYRLLEPSYPDPFAGGGTDTLPPRDLVIVAPRISIPYTVQYSAGIEHEIRKGTTVDGDLHRVSRRGPVPVA